MRDSDLHVVIEFVLIIREKSAQAKAGAKPSVPGKEEEKKAVALNLMNEQREGGEEEKKDIEKPADTNPPADAAKPAA